VNRIRLRHGADIGAGGGVYATDIQPEMLQLLEQGAPVRGLPWQHVVIFRKKG
jgi:hypothetical protein